MKAVEFKEVNVRISEHQEEYQTLPVHAKTDDPTIPVTMCFELDEEEREQVVKEGKIWLTMLIFGKPFQPIGMSCLKPKEFE